MLLIVAVITANSLTEADVARLPANYMEVLRKRLVRQWDAWVTSMPRGILLEEKLREMLKKDDRMLAPSIESKVRPFSVRLARSSVRLALPECTPRPPLPVSPFLCPSRPFLCPSRSP